MDRQPLNKFRLQLLTGAILAFGALLTACDKPQEAKVEKIVVQQGAEVGQIAERDSLSTIGILPAAKARPIVAMAINADETLLATAQGKKVAVWDIKTGEMKYALQIPKNDWLTGSKFGGNIMAIAFDPKNKYIAIGGVSDYIYLFDPSTGQKISKILIPNKMTTGLCLSQNGNVIVTTGVVGLFFYSLSYDKVIFSKLDSGKNLTSYCSFTPFGIMATNTDGFLRVYKINGDNIATIRMPDNTIPANISLNNKKDRFAIALIKKGKVLLGIGKLKDFRIEKNVYSENIQGDFARAIAWYPDDSGLCSGGSSLNKNGEAPIFCWDKMENPNQITGVKGIVQALIMLKNKKIILATDEPAWYVISPKGKIISRHDTSLVDMTLPSFGF